MQDGKIEAEVKLTGILSLGALKAGENRRHGTVIAPGLYAPVHQHFFVARLDMAVDCKPGEGLNQVHTTSEKNSQFLVHTCTFLAKWARMIQQIRYSIHFKLTID